jgi:hypothetical protein
MTGKKSIETSPIRLECDGLTTRNFLIPSFHLEAGQAICLHVLLPSPAWHEDVLPILIGRTAHPSMRFFGTVAYLDRPRPHRRWWGGLYNPSARDWLITQKGLTSTEAAAVLGLVDVPADLRVGNESWHSRTMLALEACLLHPPDLLVFDTTGNDRLTIQRLFERLSSRPPDLALIYLKTRHEMDDPCLPSGTCLDLVPASPHTTLVE